MTQTERTALRRCTLFAGLPEAEADALLSQLDARERRFAHGEALWLTGDAVTSCAVILSGSIRAESLSPAGERSLSAVHGAGELVGDVLMASRSAKSPVDIIAAQDTAALFLPYRTIMASDAPGCAILRENLLAEIAAKFWHLRRRTDYLTRRALRSRLAAYLLDTAADRGSDAFTLALRREDLADFLGVNRSALSREISRLREEGIIECRRGSFRLLDPAFLAEAASDRG